MRVLTVFTSLVAVGSVMIGKSHARAQSITRPGPKISTDDKRDVEIEKRSPLQFLSNTTEQFLVNGTSFPLIPFDIGESYAGLLPNTPHGNTSLFFWFFPSTNPAAKDEITIWLDRGTGCSSLLGLVNEHGPFVWQSGIYQPVRNKYSWNNLTNIVYIDLSAGTGFSPGTLSVDVIDAANQFSDFWRRFIDTFGMQGYKVYITGEQHGGLQIPYIADALIKQNNTKYFNVKGIQINDAQIGSYDVMSEAPAFAFLNHFSSIFTLNETSMKDIKAVDEKCGFTKFLNKALTYPPPKDFPSCPDSNLPGCDVWEAILDAALRVNPCMNIYHVTDYCPYIHDMYGMSLLAGGGANDYFNRADVQKALHVPPTNFSECHRGAIWPDNTVPSAFDPLPRVIEATNNVIIAHGMYNYLNPVNGTLATIQNMTWNGAQGFQKAPTEPLLVPYTTEVGYRFEAGGVLGTAHTERGLTFSSVYGSGQGIARYSPRAAYRQLEFFLGRIGSLQDPGPFTTQ